MKWTDSRDIAIARAEKFPEQDPAKVNLVDLRDGVLDVEDFDGNPGRPGEKILVAIQAMWIEEADSGAGLSYPSRSYYGEPA